jgi:hypothetical protein
VSKILTTTTQLRHTIERAKLIRADRYVAPAPPVEEGIITEDDSPSPPGNILVHSEPDEQMVAE